MMWRARGKAVNLTVHAYSAMNNERPPVLMEDLCHALEEPDLVRNQGKRQEIRKWIGGRDLILRIEEYPEEVEVVTVSCSRTKRRS